MKCWHSWLNPDGEHLTEHQEVDTFEFSVSETFLPQLNFFVKSQLCKC